MIIIVGNFLWCEDCGSVVVVNDVIRTQMHTSDWDNRAGLLCVPSRLGRSNGTMQSERGGLALYLPSRDNSNIGAYANAKVAKAAHQSAADVYRRLMVQSVPKAAHTRASAPSVIRL